MGREAEDELLTTDQQSAHHVHDRLRDMILMGLMDENDTFSQVALSRELGVSRTPLREALRMLEREGLVQAEPNRRARVTPISAQDLDELYGLRIMLEALAVYVSTTLVTAADIAELRAVLDEMQEHAIAGDREAWEVPHADFHRRITLRGGSRLNTLCGALRDHSRRYILRHIEEPRAWAAGDDEHTGIFEAVEARDPQLAAQRMGLHLARTALTLVARMEPSYNPEVTRGALSLVQFDDRSD